MDATVESEELPTPDASLQLKKRLALYTRSRRLISKSGFYLEIKEDGSVQGTSDKHSPFAVLNVLSIGENMLTIWGAKAEVYLAVDLQGNIYTTKNEGHQCVFMELFTKDFFNVYGSFKSVNEGRPKCLNIMQDGSSEMKDFFGIPNNTCQFFWDMLSVSV